MDHHVGVDWDSCAGRNHAHTCRTVVTEIGIEAESYGHRSHCDGDHVRRVHRRRRDEVTENGRADSRPFSDPGPFLGHRTDPPRREQCHQLRAGPVDLVSALDGHVLVGPSSFAFY